MSIFSKINEPMQLFSASWIAARFFTNFGLKFDNENIGKKFNESNMINVKTEDESDLSIYFKPISNQYSIGSCVANATADAFEAQIAQRKNISPSEVPDISRLFIYWNARNLETPPEYKDNGTRIRLAFDCMARYGVPDESFWEYDIAKVNVRPSILAYREAIKHRISAFYKIDGVKEERFNQIKQALTSKNPVVFGTKINNAFRYIKNDTIIETPNGSFIGAHALIIVGWSELKQAFKVRNSWGEDWGFKGYCWMSKNYILADMTRDLWVPTI